MNAIAYTVSAPALALLARLRGASPYDEALFPHSIHRRLYFGNIPVVVAYDADASPRHPMIFGSFECVPNDKPDVMVHADTDGLLWIERPSHRAVLQSSPQRIYFSRCSIPDGAFYAGSWSDGPCSSRQDSFVSRFVENQIISQACSSISNCVCLHAAAAVVNGRSVIICGASQSGKSTLILALLSRGAALIGDDTLLFSSLTREVISSPRTIDATVSNAACFSGFDGPNFVRKLCSAQQSIYGGVAHQSQRNVVLILTDSGGSERLRHVVDGAESISRLQAQMFTDLTAGADRRIEDAMRILQNADVFSVGRHTLSKTVADIYQICE